MAKRKGGINDYWREQLRAGLRSEYFNIAMNIYKWEGMPDEIPIRYPERWLYENGMCVFCKPKGFDYMCLPVATESIQKNVYGEPSSWRVVALGINSGAINAQNFNPDNSVLIWNDDMYRATKPYVDMQIEEMINTELTTRLNINAQKMPMSVKCSQNDALQAKQKFFDFLEAEPVFFDNTTLSDEVEIFYSGVPFVGKELADMYNVYDARILEYLGIDNTSIDKKERLLVDEVESNNDKIMMMRKARFRQRELACDKINEMFGLSVSVKESEDLYDEPEPNNGGDDIESNEQTDK